jgi:hypothetical protein
MAMTALSGCRQKREEPVILPQIDEEEEKESESITQEFDFYSDDEHIFYYNFPDSYLLNGQTYNVSTDIDYETVGTRDVVQMAMDMNVEELEDIPETYEYESESGTTYELANEQVYIKEQGTVSIPVEEEVYYENQVGKPSVPTKKTITYYDRTTEEDREVEATLTDFIETAAGHWMEGMNVNGLFEAPGYGVDVYELAGSDNITVPQSAETPIWDGYENDVLKSLGLDSKYYRVTSTAWSGDAYEQDGYIMRDAIFYGDAFVSSYKATYSTEREAEGYATKVFYRVDAEDVDANEEDITTVYHIKAVVKYSLVED